MNEFYIFRKTEDLRNAVYLKAKSFAINIKKSMFEDMTKSFKQVSNHTSSKSFKKDHYDKVFVNFAL